MKCPRCKLENPPGSLVCDCGHRFPGGDGVKLATYGLKQRDIDELKRLGISNFYSMTPSDLDDQLSTGGRFVVFDYCISLIFLTLNRSSHFYFVSSQQSSFRHSIKYSLIALIAGWWGLPWGPIRTITSVTSNFKGGRDVTDSLLKSIRNAT